MSFPYIFLSKFFVCFFVSVCLKIISFDVTVIIRRNPSFFAIYDWWNYKIVALEKTTWFHFRLMKTGFLFLLQTIY